MAESIDYVKKELASMLQAYSMIDGLASGVLAVKSGRTRFLAHPATATDPRDETRWTQEERARYATYLDGAMLVNYTKKTLAAFTGMILNNTITIDVPSALDALKEDASNDGDTLNDLIGFAVHSMLKHNRAGIMIDYAKAAGSLDDGDLIPTLRVVESKDIINWRYKNGTDGTEQLSMVVVKGVRDVEPEDDEDFGENIETTYTLLRLTDVGGEQMYTKSLYVEDGDDLKLVEGPVKYTYPDGKTVNKMMFCFIGATDNDADVEEPLLYDLATLNLGHYRNSADLEESARLTGQPTPWASGLTEEWVNDILKKKIVLGSRSFIPLPENSSIGLLQAAPATMLSDLMVAKQEQMVAIGAKVLEPGNVAKTLGEVQINTAGETSTLGRIATNVALAFTKAVRMAEAFVSTGEPTSSIKLDTNYSFLSMSAQDRKQLLEEYLGGGITFSEYRSAMTRAGVAYEDDEVALQQLSSDAP